MKTLFKNDCYYQAFTQTNNLNEETVYTNARHLSFQPAKVSFKDYCNHYSSSTQNVLRRKVTALPAVIWCGIVKTTSRTAFLAIAFIPAMLSGNGKFVKVHLFCMIRDAQESFGRLMVIFNDRYGCYHIQESQLHKKLYHTSLKSKTYLDIQKAEFLKEFSTNNRGGETKKKLENLSDDEFISKIPLFHDYHYGLVSQKHINLFNYDKLTLKQINALFPYVDKTVLEKLSESHFKALLRHPLKDAFYVNIPEKFLNLLDFSTLNDTLKEKIFPSNLHYYTSEKLAHLTPQNYQFFLQNADRVYLKHVPDNHLNSLDFTTLTPTQVEDVIPLDIFTPDRLNKLSDTNLRDFFNRGQNEKYYGHISEERINVFDYEKLSEHQIELLLPTYEWQTRQKIINLSISNLLIVLRKPNNLFYLYIPHERWNDFNYKLMTKNQFDQIFPKSTSFQFLNQENFRFIIRFLEDIDFLFMPESHVPFFDFSVLTQYAIENIFAHKDQSTIFQNLSFEQLLQIMEKGYRIKADWLTPEQLSNKRVREAVNAMNTPPRARHRTGFNNFYFVDNSEHYKTLGLPSTASRVEIKKAYHQLALKCHPDKNPKNKGETEEAFLLRLIENEETFKKIGNAYEALTQ